MNADLGSWLLSALGVVAGGVTTAFGVLCAAVGALWHRLHQVTTAKDACTEKLAGVSIQLGRLEGEMIALRKVVEGRANG